MVLKKRLSDAVGSLSDLELKMAMIEIHTEDLTGRFVTNGIIYRIATELAPIEQTKPEHLIPIISRTVIFFAACKFAGISPDPKRIS